MNFLLQNTWVIYDLELMEITWEKFQYPKDVHMFCIGNNYIMLIYTWNDLELME